MTTSNECCSNSFGGRKRSIAPNTAKVTNMIEAGARCQRNMFSDIKIAIKSNTEIAYNVWWRDSMTKDVRREEMMRVITWC